MRGLLQHWTKSSIILTSKEESVWRNKRPRSRTVFFAEGRLLTWFRIDSGSLGAMILSKTTPTYSLSVYEMMIFRNSIQSGTEFYCLWRNSHLMISWKDCTNWDERVWESQDRIGIVWPGDSSEVWTDHRKMCKESNEDDTSVRLQKTDKGHSRVFSSCSRACSHASSLRPRWTCCCACCCALCH